MKTRLLFSIMLFAVSLSSRVDAYDLTDSLQRSEVKRQQQSAHPLTPAHQAFLDKRLSAMEAQAAEWTRSAQSHPDQPIWKQLADQADATVKALRTGPVLEDDMGKWASSIFAGGTPVAAYLGSTFYLDNTFFDQPAFDSKENDLRMTGYDSYLLHEFSHSQQKGWEEWWNGEKTAYTFQYRYLVASGVPEDDVTFKNTLDQLVNQGVLQNRQQRGELDKALGFNWNLPVNSLFLPPKPVAFNLAEPPSIVPKNPDVARAEVEQWKKDCLAQLQHQMDTDPEREANKKECQALWGTTLTLACPKCNVVRTWWWIENSWCSPCCEVWLYPIDRKRGDGKTYTQFAAERKKIYEDRMKEIEAQAADLQKQISRS